MDMWYGMEWKYTVDSNALVGGGRKPTTRTRTGTCTLLPVRQITVVRRPRCGVRVVAHGMYGIFNISKPTGRTILHKGTTGTGTCTGVTDFKRTGCTCPTLPVRTGTCTATA